MPNVVTFIIPVRHPENSANWSLLKANVASTVRSIASQTHPDWKGVIVANAGADLPELPEKFDVAWVDFPPNRMHEQGSADLESFRDSFRLDKGRRVLAGMLHAGDVGHFMIVDDDDFVSAKLTAFVAENRAANGWWVENGYLWGHGGNMLVRYSNFANFCGTSLIIRSDLYRPPADLASASNEYLKTMLGSHIAIKSILKDRGTPLAPLPFLGAVYRIGHPGAHSKSNGLLRYLFFKKELLRNPLKALDRLRRLRMLTPLVRAEFFGEG